jgi:hypothetical protein
MGLENSTRQNNQSISMKQTCAVDHVVIVTTTPDQVAETFRSLGFTLTPKVAHSASMGTTNQCIIMATTYIEILAIDRPTDNNAGWRSLMSKGAGLRGIAFRGTDLEPLIGSLTAAGLEVSQSIAISRPTGNEADSKRARFRICRISLEQSAGYRFFICQHLTPELIWQKPFMDHINGAQDLIAITAPSRDPVTVANTLATLQANGLPSPADAAPHVTVAPNGSNAVLSCLVSDLDPVRLLLRHNGQSFAQDGRRLVIEIPHLDGLEIRFETHP